MSFIYCNNKVSRNSVVQFQSSCADKKNMTDGLTDWWTGQKHYTLRNSPVGYKYVSEDEITQYCELFTSWTELKTGRPRWTWPPLPGDTPPTILVPYSMACWLCMVPCRVKENTITNQHFVMIYFVEYYTTNMNKRPKGHIAHLRNSFTQ